MAIKQKVINGAGQTAQTGQQTGYKDSAEAKAQKEFARQEGVIDSVNGISGTRKPSEKGGKGTPRGKAIVTNDDIREKQGVRGEIAKEQSNDNFSKTLGQRSFDKDGNEVGINRAVTFVDKMAPQGITEGQKEKLWNAQEHGDENLYKAALDDYKRGTASYLIKMLKDLKDQHGAKKKAIEEAEASGKDMLKERQELGMWPEYDESLPYTLAKLLVDKSSYGSLPYEDYIGHVMTQGSYPDGNTYRTSKPVYNITYDEFENDVSDMSRMADVQRMNPGPDGKPFRFSDDEGENIREYANIPYLIHPDGKGHLSFDYAKGLDWMKRHLGFDMGNQKFDPKAKDKESVGRYQEAFSGNDRVSQLLERITSGRAYGQGNTISMNDITFVDDKGNPKRDFSSAMSAMDAVSEIFGEGSGYSPDNFFDQDVIERCNFYRKVQTGVFSTVIAFHNRIMEENGMTRQVDDNGNWGRDIGSVENPEELARQLTSDISKRKFTNAATMRGMNLYCESRYGTTPSVILYILRTTDTDPRAIFSEEQIETLKIPQKMFGRRR